MQKDYRPCIMDIKAQFDTIKGSPKNPLRLICEAKTQDWVRCAVRLTARLTTSPTTQASSVPH